MSDGSQLVLPLSPRITAKATESHNEGGLMVLELTIPIRNRLRNVALMGPEDELPNIDPPHIPPEPPLVEKTREPAAPPSSSHGREDQEALAQLAATIKDLSHDLRDQQRQRLAEMQSVAVEVAVTIASRLIHDRIEAGDYAVENLVRQIAERLEPKDALTIFLHPADVALLEERLGERSQALTDEDGVRVVPDPMLKRGDCRAETGDVHLVLELENQLEEMRRRLLVTLPEAEAEQRRGQPGDRNLRRFPDRRQTA